MHISIVSVGPPLIAMMISIKINEWRNQMYRCGGWKIRLFYHINHVQPTYLLTLEGWYNTGQKFHTVCCIHLVYCGHHCNEGWVINDITRIKVNFQRTSTLLLSDCSFSFKNYLVQILATIWLKKKRLSFCKIELPLHVLQSSHACSFSLE